MINVLVIWPPKVEYIFSIQKHYSTFGETIGYLDQFPDLEVEVMDGSALMYFQWDFIKAYARRYDYLVVYSDLHNALSAMKAAQQCKDISPDTTTIAFGRGVHYAPDVFMEHGFDAAVTDPMYQRAILDFIRYREGKVDQQELRGIHFRENGITLRKDENYLYDISELAFPALDKLPVEQYKRISGRNQICFTVAKGCPFSCRFCRVPIDEGRTVHHRPVHEILEYTRRVKDDFASVKLLAATFTANRNWVMELCEGILSTGLQFKWIVTTRLELLDDEMLSLMSRAGCIAIAFGIETLYEETQRRVDKYLPRQLMIDQIDAIHRANIIPKGFIMLGIPGQSAQEIDHLYAFLKQNRVEIRPKEYYPYELMFTEQDKLELLRFFERDTVYKTRIPNVNTHQFLTWMIDRTLVR